MALVTEWSAEQKRAFLDQQFDAQRQHYRTQYAGARFDVIEMDHKPIGRLYLWICETDLRLMDIALVPELRGQGIGGDLMRAVLSFARGAETPVRLFVEEQNPAKRLYERLGFVEVGEQTFYKEMLWQAA